MPEGFEFPAAATEMWTPLALSAQERTLYGSHYMSAIARMKPGVSLERAREDLRLDIVRTSIGSQRFSATLISLFSGAARRAWRPWGLASGASTPTRCAAR